MNSFKERLIFLWKNEAKQAKIAGDIGMTIAGFSRIWNDNGLPKAETLKKIKELKGCSIDWLLTGEGDPFPQSKTVSEHSNIAYNVRGEELDTDEFVFIPYYNVQAAAGYGLVAENEAPLYNLAFRLDWLQGHVTNNFEKLSAISVKGDSMEGVLNDGDTILINHAHTTPRDGLYVLRINDNLLVKRLQSMPGGIINVISANEAYPAFEINLNNMTDDVSIIGRVEWFGRLI